MHGEYKVPGGKLVTVDLDEVDGRMHSVRLAGDFFLEPDEVLDLMNSALEGQPVTATGDELAAAVTAALPEDAVLFGITPEAVGIVVRRAVTGARSWREYDWEVVHPGPLPARVHVALDQVLTEEVAAGRRAPTVRFWEWEESAVVLGSFQSVRNEVDFAAAQRHGIQIIRRISGGGAMFMEAGNVVTYSIYVPAELVAGMTFAESYAFLDAWVLDALHDLGVAAVYQPLNDIASPQGKIGGAAQKRLSGGGVLHHATLSYDIDADKMVEVLRIGREKLSDKGTTSAKKRVSPLKSQTGMPRAEIIEALKTSFVRQHGGRVGELTDAELARAQELAESKFASEEWTNRVP
ncbi:lipoate--protein ligase family protein [Gulosibacter macacae]|uniref:Lipoate--protein ligase family protein n=1 Tax=Gulosibacter macacae TaxID=2488791 RepID=A0A3P3VTI2_9MICO|nr:biotin/lipoate A/B protein ligase family protein [Gulosibacter macacae]RRJ85970.1 lipoate--protein ligase family protein [Gulosibacter macacae]